MSIEHTLNRAAPPARWGRIPDATQRSGLSRSYLYQLAAKHPGLFKKAGTATIVDLPKLDQIVSNLPDANIKADSAPLRKMPGVDGEKAA
jgi:hypothetical protein